jgi:transcriptional regulator with XRE-family HTH domain
MILADKIIRLRKEKGMSQEELAERLNVSRQAVSKWECSETVPDLQKIIQLSELFSVTTDYLLKDEIISIDRNAMNKEKNEENSSWEQPDGNGEKRKLTLVEAAEYVEYKGKSAVISAVATMLCVISPITLLALLGFTYLGLGTTTAVAFGLIALFALVGFGAGLFVYEGYRAESYRYVDKGNYVLDYGVDGLIAQRKKEFRGTYTAINIAATIMCILSPLPIIVTALIGPTYSVLFAVCTTIFIVAIACLMFVYSSVRWEGMASVLNNANADCEDEHATTKINVQVNGGASWDITSAYWMLVTALYLLVSFLTNAWSITWIIWIVAAAGEMIIEGIYRFIKRRK